MAMTTALPVPHFRLLDLPPELIGVVCQHLDDVDLLRVRQVCKTLMEQSTTAYGQRFFSHLIVILHPVSLTVFLEIARHPKLSKFVKRVSISGEQIGYSVSLENREAVRIHENLQACVKRSGLDTVVLTEALPLLQNLETVRIDTEQFFYYFNPGIKCGLTYMLDQTQGDFTESHKSEDHRVYDLVLSILDRCRLYSKIGLEISLWSKNAKKEDPDVASFFDYQSPVWKEQAFKAARVLECDGRINPVWADDLLQSATDLHRVYLSYQPTLTGPHIEQVHQTFTPRYKWPNLAQIYLEHFTAPHSAFLEFLSTHRNTLEQICLTSIGFPQGTWSEALMMLRKMPRLESLYLDTLLERTAYSRYSPSNNDHDIHVDSITARGVSNVARALKVICERIRTVRTSSIVEGTEGDVYSYTVGLCREMVVRVDTMQLQDTLPNTAEKLVSADDSGFC